MSVCASSVNLETALSETLTVGLFSSFGEPHAYTYDLLTQELMFLNHPDTYKSIEYRQTTVIIGQGTRPYCRKGTPDLVFAIFYVFIRTIMI